MIAKIKIDAYYTVNYCSVIFAMTVKLLFISMLMDMLIHILSSHTKRTKSTNETPMVENIEW